MKPAPRFVPLSLTTCLAAWTLLAADTTAAGATVTTARLLDDMTNLAALAEFPDPPYTCRQFSSYDRASKSPTENWFANGDSGQFLRTEERAGRKEYVMMDAEGPGAVVRIWSANPAGTIRIYIDGATAPAVAVPMTDLLGGKFPGLARPLAGEYSKGWNLYFPIPYARGCRITSDEGGFYYHVNYRTYPAGTTVVSFRVEQIQALAARLEALKLLLAEPRKLGDRLPGQVQPFEVDVPPGETVREEFSGPAAFTRSLVRLRAADRETALRRLIVRIAFDGQRAVEAPLGDLFGSAPGINPYSSLPLGMSQDGEMSSYWFMPFRETAAIELENFGAETVRLTGEVALAEYRWTEASMHFHAKWRAQFDVPTRPMQDWNYMSARGKGVFAGVAFAIDNPVKAWWGEGDEKIYVDGESFPSHFGTGTEDYYGYAWSWPGLFTHAYHNQTRCDGPGTYGRTSVNRFHILDRIPFQKDFKFDMELWHWDEHCKVNMAVVTYWYARPGATDGFKAIRTEDAIARPLVPYVAPRVAGALEGESLRRIRVAGTAEPQDWDSTSAGQHLWWHAGMKAGDTLTLGFEAPKAGSYRVWARCLRAKDYGIHQLAINGKNSGPPIDFYNADVQPSAEIDLGVHDLKAGENEFSASVVGANPKAEPSYMFGLDYLRLQAMP